MDWSSSEYNLSLFIAIVSRRDNVVYIELGHTIGRSKIQSVRDDAVVVMLHVVNIHLFGLKIKM